MAEAATALLVLWNDVDPALDGAYNDWHAREHVPERLTVPGIVWALRYARADDIAAGSADADAAMPRYLTLYGLHDARVVDGAAYRHLLAHPTQASRAMRPALRRVTRWVCSLDVDEGVDRHGRLAVRTAGHDAPRPQPPVDAALLVATRLPHAAALPWLAGGQSRTVDGDRLEGLAADAAATLAAWPHASAYVRLPVG